MPTIVNPIRKTGPASPRWEFISVIAFAFTGLLITAAVVTAISPAIELPF